MRGRVGSEERTAHDENDRNRRDGTRNWEERGRSPWINDALGRREEGEGARDHKR